MLERIQTLVDEVFPEVVRLRRLVHQFPELAFEEEQTARLIIETLRGLDVTIQAGIAKTGVVATMKGGHPGPTVMLRADMDALPIQESNEFEFKSRHPGKMHACGHDMHTASLLGAALILNRLKEHVHGSVRFLFQPSEERLPGGAKPMIEEGVLEDQPTSPSPEVIFGQHVDPTLQSGTIGICSGMYMTSADELRITVRGTGGHAAVPHRLETDTVLVASHIVVALQSVISRSCPPNIPSVVSIGKVMADGATNILPEIVYLEGTIRSMDEEWRFRSHDLIRRIATHTANAMGATVDVDIVVGFPALYNHPEPTDVVREAAIAYVGEAKTKRLTPWFASEDFAWYLIEKPGSFFRIGTGNGAKGVVHGLHTPRFTIDEESLRLGSGFMAYLTWKYGVDRKKKNQ